MPVSITCYGGVGEIGGSKVLIEDGDLRLLLDFGIAFGRQERFFNEFLRPRAARGLLDLLALDLIPPLEGLYRADLVFPGLWERFRAHPCYRSLAREDGRPAVDGLIVSHAHLDHNGDVSYVDARVPILTTRASAFVARAMQITGTSNFERELTYTSPRIPGPTGELISDRRSPYQLRRFGFLDGELSEEASASWTQSPGTKGLEPEGDADPTACPRVCWWPVDHSIPGAIGCAIETSAGWIAYTGDIRFHGANGKHTWQFARALAALNPVALLCEGTHIGSESTVTEADVTDRAMGLVHGEAGRLVVADFAPRNTERLMSFLAVAQRTQRTLLVQPKDLYLLQAISLAAPEGFADPATLTGLGLYADPKAAPRTWEKKLRPSWSGVTAGPVEVSRDPGAYILAFSLWDANDLLDLDGIAGGAYLYCNSRAYDDEQAADLDRLRNWVRMVGLTLYGDPDDEGSPALHASGHAPGPALVEFVRIVNPSTLVPVHTEDPGWWVEQLRGSGIAVRMPVRDRPLAF
jgi:ribonuclease J